MQKIVFNLENLAEAFGGVIFFDGTPKGITRTLVKAREYLNTLGYAALFMEQRRTLELIKKGDVSLLSLEFPDTKNPKILYVMSSQEYLGLINKRIASIHS